MNALQIINNKNIIRNFSVNEFPRDALKRTEAKVLETLQMLRSKWDNYIFPSMHPLGWARTDKKYSYSEHYAIGRLSTAGDFFPAGNVFQFWLMCQSFPEIGEIGIYFDTNRTKTQPGPMIHISISSKRRLHCRINGVYHALDERASLNDFREFNKAVDEYLNKELK